MEFWENPLIAAIIGGLIGILGMLFIFHISKKKMKVAYQVLDTSSLATIKDEVKKDLKMEYKNKPIKSIHSFKIKFKNTGNVPVENLPILFEFDEGSNIFGENIETKPEKEFGTITKSAIDKTYNSRFMVDLINPNEEIMFSILTSDNRHNRVKIYSKSKGLKFYETQFVNWRNLLQLELFFAMITFIVFITTISSMMIKYIDTLFPK